MFAAQRKARETLRRVLINEQSNNQDYQANKIAKRNGSSNSELTQNVDKIKQAELMVPAMTAGNIYWRKRQTEADRQDDDQAKGLGKRG